MLRYKVAYLVFLCLAVALFVFYPAYISFFLLASMLLLTALSAAATLVAVRRLRVRLTVDNVSAHRDDGELLFTLTMKNPSLLPLPMVRLCMRFENTLNGSVREQLTFLSVGPRGRGGAQYSFSSAFCGRITVELTKLRVYDYLGLFSFPRKTGQRMYAFIVPSPGDGTAAEALNTLGRDDLPVNAAPRQESDSMELFGIRDYRETDRLRSIHWKVSIKLDELMVKQYTVLEEPSVVIMCELSADDPALLDMLVCTAVSLSELFAEHGIAHRVEWHDRRLGENVAQRVLCERDCADMLYGILSASGYKRDALALVCHETPHGRHMDDAFAFYVTGLLTDELAEFAARPGAMGTTVLYCGTKESVQPSLRQTLSEMGVNIIEVRAPAESTTS